MRRKLVVPALAIMLVPSACKTIGSEVSSTNVLDGKVMDYSYQIYTMSERVEADTFQAYVKQNNLLASDPSERVLPKELQGLFFLDGAPFPDKTLSLKHAAPMDAKANRIRWSVPYKTTFSWLNIPEGHKAFAAAKSHDIQYELEWRDCTDEVMADMAEQFAAFKLAEAPSRCKASDRRFAVINAYASYEGERFAIPESILYFDMYLIPKNDERDYYVWHRRSKICSDSATGAIGAFCDALRMAGFKPPRGEGYSRYNFTQVITPEGERTSKYNSGLLPEVKQAAGEKNNIFLICDTSADTPADACIDGTETLPPMEERDIPIVSAEEPERGFFAQISRTRKFMGYVVKATIDLIRMMATINK